MSDQPRSLIGWRAWVAAEPDARDVRVLDSTTSRFSDLTDVQIILLYREDGTRHVMNGVDFYWLGPEACESKDTCFGCGNTVPPDASVVVLGKQIDEEAYDLLRAQARAARTF